MYSQNYKTKAVNPTLTNMIIWLHDHGYTEDFSATTQNGRLMVSHILSADLAVTNFQIFIINQFFDRLTNKFIYLHAIETNCGLKGIVLSQLVLFADNSQPVTMVSEQQKITSYRRRSFAYQVAI